MEGWGKSSYCFSVILDFLIFEVELEVVEGIWRVGIGCLGYIFLGVMLFKGVLVLLIVVYDFILYGRRGRLLFEFFVYLMKCLVYIGS